MSATKQFVDVREAGKVLGVSESTIWRMIRRGALPSIRRSGGGSKPGARDKHSILDQ